MHKSRALLIALAVLISGAVFVLPVPVSATTPILHDFDTATQYPSWLTGTATILENPGDFLGTPSASGQALLVTGDNNTLGPGWGIQVSVEFILSQPVYISTLTAWAYNSQANFTTFQLFELSGTGSIINSFHVSGVGTGIRTLTLNRVISNRFIVNLHKSGFGGTTTIGIDDIQINVNQPLSPSPTPSASPTPTPTPNSSGVFIGFSRCVLIGEDRASFREGWQFSGGAQTPDSATFGVSLPPGGTASTTLALSSDIKYSVFFRYRATAAIAGASFRFTLGDSTLPVVVADTSQSQSFTAPAANYLPTSGGSYTFSITYPSVTDIGLIVEYACIVAQSASGGGVGFEPETCEACDYVPTGDVAEDIVGIIVWLFCAIKRLVECQITLMLNGIYRFLGEVVLTLVSFVKWILDSTGEGIVWANGTVQALAYYLAGTLDNTISIGVVTVGGGAGFFDALISLFNLLGGVITTGFNQLGNIFTTLINGLRDVLLEFLGIISDALGAFVALVVTITRLIQSFAEFVFTIAPELLNAFSLAFNGKIESADIAEFNEIAQAFTCTTPGSNLLINSFCEANFILSNTVFAGINRVWLVLLAGLIGLSTLFSTLKNFRKAFQ